MKYQLPAYNEIPNIGLYLDQVTKYINTHIEPITHTTVTNSMISNYVKKGMVENPIKKLYYRDQIAYLLYINIAKQVMTLENMQILFDIIKEKYENRNAYEYLCIEFNNAIEYVFHEKDELDPITDDYSQGRILLRNTVMAMAHKIYLDYCFENLKNNDL